MTRRQAPQGTQAVLRAIRLVKTFTEARSEMTLQDLASAARLTKTTTHRLLAALESEGLVARGPAQHTYRLGPSMIALGVQALRTSDLRAAAHSFLSRLAEATGETVTMEVLSDDQMLILDEVSGRHLVSVLAEIGTRWPLHATSTGKAVLANLPEEQIQVFLNIPLTRHTPSTITSWDDLRKELEQVRRNGYATAIEELESDFTAVGAAIRGPMGDVEGAISVGGPSSRVGADRLPVLGARVRATAEEISRALGFDPQRSAAASDRRATEDQLI